MTLTDQYIDFEYQLLESTTDQRLPLIKALSQNLSNFLFLGMKINTVIMRESYSYHCDFENGKITESNSFKLNNDEYLRLINNIQERCKKTSHGENYTMIYDITDVDFILSYNSTNEKSPLFTIHASNYYLNKNIAHEFVNNTKIINRLFSLIIALYTQRFLGDITYEITQFTQKKEQKLSIGNLKEALELLKQLTILKPTDEPTDLIERLITFVYHTSIVERHRMDIHDNSPETRESRVAHLLTFLKNTAITITNNKESDPTLKERHYCMLCIVEFLYKLHIKDQNLQSLSTNRENTTEIVKLVKSHKLEIYININLKDGGSPHLYQLTELLIQSNQIIHIDKTNITKVQFQSYCNKLSVFLPSIIQHFNNEYLTELEKSTDTSLHSDSPTATRSLILNTHILRLMFIYHALSPKTTSKLITKMTRSELKKFTVSLAYVIQETLRHLRCRKDYYTTRPVYFINCILHLIEVHAEKTQGIKLPVALFNNILPSDQKLANNAKSSYLSDIEKLISNYFGCFVVGHIGIGSAHNDLMSVLANSKLTLNTISQADKDIENINTAVFRQCMILCILFNNFSFIPPQKIDKEQYEKALRRLVTHDIVEKNELNLDDQKISTKLYSAVINCSYLLDKLVLQNIKFKSSQSNKTEEDNRYLLDREAIIKPTIRCILFHNTAHCLPQIAKAQEPLTTYLAILDEFFNNSLSANDALLPEQAMHSYNDFSFADIRPLQGSIEMGVVLENVEWRVHSITDFNYADYLDEELLAEVRKFYEQEKTQQYGSANTQR